MPVKLNSSGGGSVTLTTPSTASDYTVTVPAITGTMSVQASTGYTTGSVLFINSSGQVAQSNAQFFWDNTNNYLGVGTSSPGEKFDVKGGFIQVTDTTGSGGYRMRIGAGGPSGSPASLAYIEARDSLPLAFYTSTTERARITSGGDFYFGQTTGATPPTSGADLVAGGLVINPSRRTTAATTPVCVWDSTSGTFSRSTSSLKYKKDVQDATYGLSDVLNLRPVTFKGKSESDGDRVFGGLIAEEVDAAGLTMFVDYAEDGTPDGLGYSAMVSLAFKAIQELSAKLDAAEARIAALEGAK